MRKCTISESQRVLLENLYHGQQRSVREIAEQLDVGMSAVYRFMRKHALPRRDASSWNQLRFERKPLSYALKRRLSKEQEQLKLAGVMLYWGEGAKGGQTVDFANSNVDACVIFIRFLRDICGVNEKRLRGYLYCHSNQDQKKLIGFWSRMLRLPGRQFTKPYVRKYSEIKKVLKKRPERMEYGLVHVRYSDLKLLRQINKWIEEYIKIFGQVPK